MSEVTRILAALDQGDAQATDQLLPLVYDELRRLASQRLGQERPQTLQPTDLVHEAYLRLVGPQGDDPDDQSWESRGHFFKAAAEAMRRILIDRARRRARLKHGGGRQELPLEEGLLSIEETDDDIIALDEALAQFSVENHVKAELVKLRYFAGLTIEEAARVLGISRATADRYWAYARAWLFDQVSKGDTQGEGHA